MPDPNLRAYKKSNTSQKPSDEKITQEDLKKIFNEVLKLYPELKDYKIELEFFESKPGFSKGRIRRRGDQYVVKIAHNLIEDEVDAEFTIAHELAHLIVDPKTIPKEGEGVPPNLPALDMLDNDIAEVICDWMAFKRLERKYEGDNTKLRRLYERYLESTGLNGYTTFAERYKEDVVEEIMKRDGDKLKQIFDKFFMGLKPDLKELNMFTVLAIAKYLSIQEKYSST